MHARYDYSPTDVNVTYFYFFFPLFFCFEIASIPYRYSQLTKYHRSETMHSHITTVRYHDKQQQQHH